MDEVIRASTAGALEFVFGGLFVGLFLFVLWEKRQTERRLMEQNERLAETLRSTISSLGAVEGTIRQVVRDEIQEVLRWMKNDAR